MASRRAIQAFTLRNSTSLLRSQCAVPSRIVPRIASVRVAIVRPQVACTQQRWHSHHFPSETRSKIYQFQDIRDLIEDPNNTDLLIDVREPSEFEVNSIPTAINVPIASQPDALLLPDEEFEDRFGFQKPPKEKHMVFFCKAGVRSAAAAQIAKQAGYQSIGEYRGSWLDWERNGGIGSKTGPVRDDQPGQPQNPEVTEWDAGKGER
ncbi:Rhodanese-like domain-containing protein [Dendryphion nanum]|uniref:Rhodanese-like domain-containing protein n=1 Tax=Dendryphion nanum TaxID=256645 RepID=A0A9P9E291_9PLEO|nr:Rhodanese-like domain-containing protein [Dendryphion nanum]